MLMNPTDAQVKHMVERFLSWKLPPDFSPDGGISFEKIGSKGFPSEFVREGALGPSGTNLFNFPQATEMVRHMVEGAPESERTAWLIERHINSRLFYYSAGAPSLDQRAQHRGDGGGLGNLCGWCTDVNAAVRFARQEDASLVLDRLGGPGRVAEHKWVAP